MLEQKKNTITNTKWTSINTRYNYQVGLECVNIHSFRYVNSGVCSKNRKQLNQMVSEIQDDISRRLLRYNSEHIYIVFVYCTRIIKNERQRSEQAKKKTNASYCIQRCMLNSQNVGVRDQSEYWNLLMISAEMVEKKTSNNIRCGWRVSEEDYG